MTLRNNLSYAEAYTELLSYYSKKENKKIDEVVILFKNLGIEASFKNSYLKHDSLSTSEYYKRIKKALKTKR